MKINVIDKSSEYECRWEDQGDGSKRLWIVETNSYDKGSIWFPTFSKYCHHVVIGGECINCSLVVEED
jgi:hypothetical protein